MGRYTEPQRCLPLTALDAPTVAGSTDLSTNLDSIFYTADRFFSPVVAAAHLEHASFNLEAFICEIAVEWTNEDGI